MGSEFLCLSPRCSNRLRCRIFQSFKYAASEESIDRIRLLISDLGALSVLSLVYWWTILISIASGS